jgi:hypothetical protein
MRPVSLVLCLMATTLHIDEGKPAGGKTSSIPQGRQFMTLAVLRLASKKRELERDCEVVLSSPVWETGRRLGNALTRSVLVGRLFTF